MKTVKKPIPLTVSNYEAKSKVQAIAETGKRIFPLSRLYFVVGMEMGGAS